MVLLGEEGSSFHCKDDSISLIQNVVSCFILRHHRCGIDCLVVKKLCSVIVVTVNYNKSVFLYTCFYSRAASHISCTTQSQNSHIVKSESKMLERNVNFN